MLSLSKLKKTGGGFNTKEFINKYAIVLILLGMMIFLSILSPVFLTTRNLTNVLRQISVTTIIGFGVTFTIITTGIDLSSGSLVALVGVIAASYAHPGSSIIVAILIGCAVGALAGLINGSISAYGKIPPFIATLGMMIAARGVALLYTGGTPVTNLSPAFQYIGSGYFLGVPVPIIIMLLVAIISHILLKHTKFGKYTFAVGGNERAALVSGINVKKHLVLIYGYAGLLSGIAAIVLASRLDAGQPTAGLAYEFDAITAAVIGGTSLLGGVGSIPGVIVGGLIVGFLTNGLDLMNVSSYWQQILKGIIIVAAVLLDRFKNK
ncbi:MAG: inositol transport system permease protein [Clostridium sp.]|jgi:inositol transport system permease protein